VHAIRQQPFSVVLLDEFEKAHEGVWDLFLQVFDDGRLTDTDGDVADFRHAIVILTSNLGAELAAEPIGFGAGGGTLDLGPVESVLLEVFRREFLNRLDRVVVFRPLGAGVMREILVKELESVLARRGLRNRQWAVEWDGSALEFLLEQGFSTAYGARPLKRAIDRHLLAPLARTIVNHQVPDGDQFLFVRSDGERLEVEFVDPDQDDSELPDIEVLSRGDLPFTCATLVLDGRGAPTEVAYLRDVYTRLEGVVASEPWRTAKQGALARFRRRNFGIHPSVSRCSVMSSIEIASRRVCGLQAPSSAVLRVSG
jgi:ATP-dependent Clp protease ATP-binding subunit ClpC